MSLLDTLLTAYMYENSKNSDPKVTTAPSTPGEQFILDQFKNAVSNPSPQRQIATSAATQALGNMGSFNPSSFSFVSPIMQGQTFAGGMKIPSFDFSKIDMTKGFGTGGSTPSTGTGTTGNPGATTGGSGAGGGDATGVGPFYGVPAAPQYTGTDVPTTTGTDVMGFAGRNADKIASLLTMLGVPAGMATALQSYLAAHLAGQFSQNLTPVQSPTLQNWANQPQTPLQLPTNTPSFPDLTPGGGAGGGDDPQKLPTQQPYIPNLTPKT